MNDSCMILQSIFPAACHDSLFLVGGTVRDLLLGRQGSDLDLVATSLPNGVLHELGFSLVQGRSTLPVWFRNLPGVGNVELTILPLGSSLADDLRRRDFTVNAIAMTMAGELLDPLDGRHDLDQRWLKACSDESLKDDPLRMFRGFRFEADGWRMLPETEALIRRQDWQQELKGIPAERFSREMVKALAAEDPARFLCRMLEFGVGEHWLPELFRMPQVPAGPLEYHPEGDLLTHSLQVLQRVALQTPEPLARFCGLFHDIGKLSTDPALYPRHHGHDKAGFEPALKLCQRLKLPAAWGRALAWTSRLHMHLNLWQELRDATKIKTAWQAAKGGIAAILPLVSAADKPCNAVHGQWWQAVEAATMNTKALGVDVERLAALSPAKRKEYLLQRRIEFLRTHGYTEVVE